MTRISTRPETIFRRIDLLGLLLERANKVLFRVGLPVFSLAITALGVETFACAHRVIFLYPLESNPRFKVIPVLPFLPAISWLAYSFGVLFAVCGVGLLFKRYMRVSSAIVGTLLFLCTVILDAPKYAAIPGSMSLRTVVFEPLAMAALAWLLPGAQTLPPFVGRASRYILGVSFIVFGIDHFLALAPIGTLLPNWIPYHVFWIGFFGAGFVAAGLSIGLGLLLRWAAACVGLMFAIWVFTLHLPRVLGLYGIPGAPHSPAEWSSLFIAVAMWGGSWALARSDMRPPLSSRAQSST